MSMSKIFASMLAVGLLAGCGTQAAAPTLKSARPGSMAVKSRAAEGTFNGGVVTRTGALEQSFTTLSAGEGLLDLKAVVPNGDWEIAGRESVTLRLSIDGVHNQDVVLHQGDRLHTYKLSLGAIQPGPHTAKFEFLDAHSGAALDAAELRGGQIAVVSADDPEYAIFANAPIIMSRPDVHKSNTPVLMSYEWEQKATGDMIRYVPVVTDEDIGWPAYLRMAFWGRTTDIEWAYRLERDAQGKTVAAKYQAFQHMIKSFKGDWEAKHPVLRVSTRNNLYNDSGEGTLKLRLAPSYRQDSSVNATAEVMDAHPWIYRTSSKELYREGEAQKGGITGTGMLPTQNVGDPRHYMTVEFFTKAAGKRVAVAVTLKGDTKVYTSHRNSLLWAAAAPGWNRVGIELPRAVTKDEIARLDVIGVGPGGTTTVTEVRKVQTLSADFEPQVLPIAWHGDVKIGGGQDRLPAYVD